MESKMGYIKSLGLQYKLNKEQFDLVWKAMDGYGDYRELEGKYDVMNKCIDFAEWVEWENYQRFHDRKDLWYDKNSSYQNPLPIKTTKDLWDEFVKHCS